MVQSAGETKLKAIIKRRDTKIVALKTKVNVLSIINDDLETNLNLLQQQRQDFKQTLIEFLNLDQHIRDIVRESL